MFCCSVAVSNGFVPDYSKALCLHGHEEKKSYKEAFELLPNAMDFVCPWDTFFSGVFHKNIRLMKFTPELEKIKSCEHLINDNWQITQFQYDKIARQCDQIVEHHKTMTAAALKLDKYEIENSIEEANVIITGETKVAEIIQRVEQDLLKVCPKTVGTNGDELHRVFGNTQLDSYTATLSGAISIVFEAWSELLEKTTSSFKSQHFDGLRSRIRCMPVYHFLKMFFYCTDPAIEIKPEQLVSITSKSNELYSAGANVEHYVGNIYGQITGEDWVAKIADEAEHIIRTIDEIIYELLEHFPNLGHQYIPMRSPVPIDAVPNNDSSAPSIENKKQFLTMIFPICDSIFDIGNHLYKPPVIGEEIDPTRRIHDFIEIVVLQTIDIQFALRAYNLLTAYENTRYLTWRLPSPAVQQQLSGHNDEIKRLKENIYAAVESFENTALKAGADKDSGIRNEFVRSLITHNGKIATELYRAFEIVLPALPASPLEDLNENRGQLIDYINELRQLRDLYDV